MEPESTVETALYGSAWDEPLPAVVYQDREDIEGRGEQRLVRDSFKIDDQGKANWAIRRISEARKRWGEVVDVAQAETERIENWLDKVQTKEERESEFFISLLKDYAHDELANSDGKSKSIPLSEGTLKFIKKQPKLHYDENKLIEELESEGLEKLIRRKAEPHLVEIKAALKSGFE
ncbi:hypothetical protein LCGC14_1730670, partial [marine sediment metagenome]